MALRRSGSWLVTVALVATGLLAVASDVGAAPVAQVPVPAGSDLVGANRVPLAGGPTGLPALPSVAPAAGFAAGGGGLAGATWGLFGDPADDAAVMRAVGVQVDLSTPGWGAGARYAVLEAGTNTQVWPASGTSTASVVPAGVLRDGGAYELVVNAGGVPTRRAVTVDASRAGSVGGAMTASVSSTPVTVNTGQKMTLGLGFSSADVGVTPTTGAVGRLSTGLPAGWSWSGVGADVWRVEVVAGSASLPGVERIVKVYGTGVLVLGCAPAVAGVSVCDAADGQLVGEGPRAIVKADGTVVLTSQSAGQTLTFDAAGRVLRIAQPGTPPVAVTYTAAGGLATVTWEVGAPLVWRVVYAGDADCDESALPPGFAPAASGAVCGWRVPSGQLTRILYTEPTGGQPRISRIVQLPDCAPSMAQCDPNLSLFVDYGWDEANRLAAIRDTVTARAVIAGMIGAADTTHWQQTSYDGQGRLVSERSPSPVLDDRGRLVASATVVVSNLAYGPAEAGFAPATEQVAATTSGAGSSLTTTVAVDDGGRVIGARSPAGAVARSVWAPYDDALLAEIHPNGQATTTVYDRWFRRTGKHTGPLAEFGSGCSPTSPQRGATDAAGDWTACAPVPGATRVASQVIAFDAQARVGAGLTATVFAPAATGVPSPFAGNPVAHAAADQAGDGIAVAGVAADAPAGSGIRLDGGLLAPPDTSVPTSPWTLRVEVTPDLVSDGVVLVDGRFCAVLQGGLGSCSVNPDTRPQHVTIDVETARVPTAADRLIVGMTDPLGDPAVVGNANLVRRWSANTMLTKIDPVPAGTIPGWSPISVTEHTYGCAPASAPLAERVACIGSATSEVHDDGGAGITRSYTYEADGFGAVRLATATKPDGKGSTTFTHWGVDETPAGLPHADQLGDLVSVPQRGLPRTTTLPGGRTTTTVYDQYGNPLCHAVDGGNWTCTTLDVTQRPVLHTVRADTAGVAPVTITTDYAPAGNPLINRTTRAEGGRATLTEQTTLAPSGRVIGYTDTLNTTTAYGFDAMGRLASTTITPPAVPGRVTRPRPPGASTAFTYAATFDAATGLQTGVTYQGQPLMSIAYGDGAHPFLPTEYTYRVGAGASVRASVNYDSDLNPFGRTWTLADGSTLLDCATTAVNPTACTAAIGDTQPGTTASGRLLARSVDGRAHRFTYDGIRRLTGAQVGATTYAYSWDANNNLTGRTIDGASRTYTYDDADRLTATTDPLAAIGGFDADGNHTAIGPDTYTYDALDQMVSTTNSTTATTLRFTRDPRGRITTRTASPGGATFLGYSLATDRQPSVAIDATGAATPLLALPGGLLYRGTSAAPLLTDMQGNTLLALTVDGRRPTLDGASMPVAQYEPFGAPTPDTPAAATVPELGWQQFQSDGPLAHVGVRELHTRLGVFLQPDPRPRGSQAGPYSYTNADPINQADPTGLCVGAWGCVKYSNRFLAPIADALTLLTCAFSFGVACFALSLIRVGIAALNFAADFKLHQDAAADGVTLVMSIFNLAAATPFLYQAAKTLAVARELGVERSAIQEASQLTGAARRTAAMEYSGYAAAQRGWNEAAEEAAFIRYRGLTESLDSLNYWGSRASVIARIGTGLADAGEYGALITSGNLHGCCWKLW